jgi:hypothetical protein
MEEKKYNQKNLIAALENLSTVKIKNWTIFSLIRDAFLKNDPSVSVLSKKWTDKWGHNEMFKKELDLSDEKNWCVFADAYVLEFSIFENRLHCYAKLYEGVDDSYITYFNRSRSGKFDVEFTLPMEFVDNIGQYIIWRLEERLGEEYEDFLDKQRLNWIEEQKNKMFGIS